MAARACRLRRPGHAAEQQRHAVLLPAALPQQRVDGGAVVGAELRCDARARQVVLRVEVLGRRHPHGATSFVYIGEVCTYLLNQDPPKDTDRKHKVRVIAGNGLRPAIWDDFTERFGIDRVCEFYAASEGNTAFVNVLNVDKTTGICPTPVAFVEYDESGDPVRDKDGRVRKVANGEPGLLLSKVSNFQPFDGYTDKEATEKKLVRDAFKEGDVWFNTGDLMRSQGFGHAAFTDRLGDTFRWKGENVATTEVEAAVSTDPQVEEATVFGVEVPDTGGRAGMVAVQLKEGQEFDGKALAKAVYDKLPGYAVPLFVRVVKELAHTSTFKSQKVDLRKEGYGGSSGEGDDDDVKVEDPIYVLSGRDEGVRAVLRRVPERGQGRQEAQVGGFGVAGHADMTIYTEMTSYTEITGA